MENKEIFLLDSPTAPTAEKELSTNEIRRLVEKMSLKSPKKRKNKKKGGGNKKEAPSNNKRFVGIENSVPIGDRE